MLDIVIAIVFICLISYAIFAGADLGAGILELFHSLTKSALSKNGSDDNKQNNLSIHALKPVWEINHIWLGLAAILIFTIFPKAFYQLFTTFAFPIVFIFIGLFIRGFSFSLRSITKYAQNKILKNLFNYSSLWISFWLGNLVGALTHGKATSSPLTFYQGYIAPWLSLYSILTGIFCISLFSFMAAMFLHTETQDKTLQSIFKKYAIYANILAIVIGLIILVTAFYEVHGITFYFLQSKVSLLSFILATLMVIASYYFLKKNHRFLMRFFASVQMFLILLGLFGAQFPIIFQTNLDKRPKTLTFYNSVAQDTSLTAMLLIVVIVLIITIPTYVYLYKISSSKISN